MGRVVGRARRGADTIKSPQRFTLDNRGIWSVDSWTPNSQALLFSSSQNGSAEVFRKGLNENIEQAIVRGAEGYRCARLTADGSWLLYVEWRPTAPGATPVVSKNPISPSTKRLRAPAPR